MTKNPDERLDDLQFDGLKIYQNKNMYCFSSDAILLCNFVKAKSTDTIVDLCSGSGVVGILAQAKTHAKKLILVEKQKVYADMCQKSIEHNNLCHKAQVVTSDIKDVCKLLGAEIADVVCCNPPYFVPSKSLLTGKREIDVAKFELEVDLDTVCKTASKLLKFGGKFFMVHDSTRICQIFESLKKYNLEPKIAKFVFAKEGATSNVVLVEAKKGAKIGAKIFCDIVKAKK